MSDDLQRANGDRSGAAQDQTFSSVAGSAGIVNGDFESGQDGSWDEYSSNGLYIIMPAASLPMGVTPHAGSWVAWMGWADDDTSYISQTVTIPVTDPTLNYWYWITSSETNCTYDYAVVNVDGHPVRARWLCTATETSGWVEDSVDLTAYAGQTVSLQFLVATDISIESDFYLDDVTLGGASTTFLPLVLNNYWPGYADHFDDESSGWLTGEDEVARFGYLSGEYQIYLKEPQSGYWITPGTDQMLVLPSDYRVEADMRMVSSGNCSYGLRFSQQYATDAIAYYEVTISPATGEYATGVLTMDGSWTTIVDWTYAAAIHQDHGTNKITVDRTGSTTVLRINGVQVASFTDATLLGPGRDAGFVVYSDEDVPVDVRFDNFSASMP